MRHTRLVRGGLASAAVLLTAGLATEASAGAFGVREQSAYFQGSSFAGSAAGGDISSMFWNSAATATLPGFNVSSNITAVFGHADINAQGGAFVTGFPAANIAANPLNQADVGTDGIVPSSYASYQLCDRLYAGLAMNAPFGFITKPDNVNYAGSAVAVTSKVFSLDLNPTLAYKLTPDITIGVGAQVEYFKIRLNKSASLGLIPGFPPASAARSYDADDWGFGATAGIIWTPTRTTTIGLGYRSAVSVDPSGSYIRGAQINAATRGITPGVATTATGAIDLPDEVTLSLRQMVSPRLALLGTVEWTNWSRVGNVTAKGAGCGPTGACETLNLNYKDGWLFSGGLEYAWSPSLTLRTGVGYEISPIDSSTRNILLPDSDRIHVSVGASYKYSDRITLDIGYSHLFMEDNARFCTAAPNALAPTTHCVSPTQLTLLSGTADASIDILSFGLKYNISGPVTPLEPYK